MKTICKRFIVLIIVLPFFLSMITSCGDKEDSPQAKSLRIKELTSTFTSEIPEQPVVFNTLYQYNDNLVLSAIVGYNRMSDSIGFSYNSSGGITSTEHFLEEDIITSLQYQWDDNKVTKTEPNFEWYKVIFELNSDGQVTRSEVYIRYNTGLLLEYYSTFLWKNGNIVLIENYYNDHAEFIRHDSDHWFGKLSKDKFFHGWTSSVQLTQTLKQSFYKGRDVRFVYDNMNNPIKGFQYYKFMENSDSDTKNNIIQSTTTFYDMSGGVEDVFVYQAEYEYNPDNYPISRSSTLDSMHEYSTFTYY